jgi:ubiquinone/menaquinone biosynthesis C-methylase UbiE
VRTATPGISVHGNDLVGLGIVFEREGKRQPVKKRLEEPLYGFKGMVFLTLALVGAGAAVIALAIVFTVLSHPAWQAALCWVLGLLLVIAGLFWDSMSSVGYPSNQRALEENMLGLLRTHWNGKGKVLDIGTGGGRLAVPIAKNFPEARVIGVDIWPKSWSFFGLSKERAESNAQISKVSDRCTFRYGDAKKLPFGNAEFSLVVSAFTFHGVSVPDRTVLLKEAVRVLAPGGKFMICDLFPRGYQVKSIRELIEKVQGMGVDDASYRSLKEAGVDLGRLSFIWGMAYLGGTRKRTSPR